MEQKDYNKKAIHTPYMQPDPYGALSMPVYNCAAYEFESAEAMEAAFSGKTPGFVYSRISNPTVQYFEERVKSITNALSVTALNSGMAAISNALMTIAYDGCNIITSRHLFGNTYSLLVSTLADFGIEVRFCDLKNSAEVEKNIDKHTCAIFLEIISNPQLEVVDLKALSTTAHRRKIPLIADTTIIPFCSFQADTWGIDIEIVASTKYISGGATSVGGLILDYGKFDWSSSKKLRTLAKDHGKGAFTFKLKREVHRNLGAYMTPQVAYMQTLGLETMKLRYKKASETASQLALWLTQQSGVQCVNYTGLKTHPDYELSRLQFGEHPGAMLTFDMPSQSDCFRVINQLQLIKRATNLFDNKSLAIHPYTTIFGTFSEAAKAAMHVMDTTIRLSIGLEDFEDLCADLERALS